MDFSDIVTAGILATVIPSLLGTLVAYSIIATILGALLWAGKSLPDDIGIAILASGVIIGILLVLGVLFIRLVLS